MRRRLTSVLLLLVVPAAMAFVPIAEEGGDDPEYTRGYVQRLYLRWTPPSTGTSCGSDTYLSIFAGSNDVVCTQLYATGVTRTFTTRNVTPQRLDALEDITGTVSLGPAVGVTYGVGVVDATVQITAQTPAGTKTLGTHTEQIVLTPATAATGGADIDYTFNVSDTLDTLMIDNATITVQLSGPQVLPWDFRLNGSSWFDMPYVLEAEDA